MNILFTCAGRRVALLHAFRHAMAKLDVAGKLVAGFAGVTRQSWATLFDTAWGNVERVLVRGEAAHNVCF